VSAVVHFELLGKSMMEVSCEKEEEDSTRILALLIASNELGRLSKWRDKTDGERYYIQY
jgi:hypothetical protein